MRRIYTIYILALSLLTASLQAADLPKLADDKAVTRGALPNGMTYYLVANPSSKGMADFALVQRTGYETSQEIKATALARKTLLELPHIGGGISPQVFFSSNGVNPSRNGFVKVDEGYTMYHFQDLMLSQKADLLDSALVVIMGMADKLAQQDGSRKWYAPSDNAIIISGDIDSKAVAGKLKMLSYMTPSSDSQQRKAYEWADSEEPVYDIVSDPVFRLSEIKVAWRAPRVPEKYVGTVQPYFQKMFLAQIGDIAVSRIKHKLAESGIPCASASYRHFSSSEGSSDETFTIKVTVDGASAEKALSVIAETVSSLESAGAGKDELELSRRRCIRKLRDRMSRPFRSNGDYVKACFRSFLYGAPLAMDSDVLAAYTSRTLSVEMEKTLFKEVADALFDPQKNLTVECQTSGRLMDSLARKVFEESWSRGAALPVPEPLHLSDTLFNFSESPKTGVKPAKKDHISGGSIWTFSNGLKVIYKKMDTSGQLYWSMGLGAGFSSISDLEKGEGAFVGDCLWLYRIAGMKGEDFRDFLGLSNISMDVRVSQYSSELKGSVYKDNLRLLLRSLAAIANERELDRDAFAVYMKNERLRLEASVGSHEERRAIMDSLMCPDYNYSEVKSRGKLKDKTLDRAHGFYEDRFSRMNDGVLVIVGDIDETVLKKELQMMAGFFRTRKSVSYTPSMNYQPVSGCSTYTVDGGENSVYLTLSVQMPLTAENKMASEIAAKVLQKSLSAAIENTGMYVEIGSDTRFSPQERFNVMLSLKEASPEGFAEGMEQTGALDALRIVRSALYSLETTEVTDAIVKAYKEWLKNDIALRQKSPRYWLSAITMRHLEGKDFTTGSKAKIDAVDTARVRQILTSLNNASKVEYIILKR